MMIATDSELLQLWTAGHTDAAARLVERHYAAVRAYVSSQCREEIEDLTQSTFLICLATACRFRGDSAFRTFLLGIAHHLILAARRSRNKSDSLDQNSATLLDNVSVDGADDLVLQEAMGKLSPELRTAITLSYWAGLTEDEISRSVGCPRGTVASRIRRGKTQLRQLLQAPESSD